MKHVLEKGTNNKLIITLHGTGGHATQLFDIAKMIDKEATLLGIEGDVVEQGMKRYFERFPDGNYNFDSLDSETQKLYTTILELIDSYQLKQHELYLMGYSNGANMIVNLLKNHNLSAKGHIILHPAIMRMNVPYTTQNSTEAFITSGKQDPYFSQEALDTMMLGMKSAQINPNSYMSIYGHQLVQEEIDAIKSWYNKVDEK